MTNMIRFPNRQKHKIYKNSKRWTIFVNDLVISCFIGINSQEALAPQRLRINLKCKVDMPLPNDQDYQGQFVCYDQLVQSITQLAQSRHTHLVETLAEDIAQTCFKNQRITEVWCRVEKLDVYPNAGSVGVEIERQRG